MQSKLKGITTSEKTEKTTPRVRKTKIEQNYSSNKNSLAAIVSEWHTALDAVTDAICILDKNRRILHSNRSMREMFDVSEEEIIGKHCWKIVHQATRPVPDCPVKKSEKSLEPKKIEIEVNQRTFRIAVYPIFNSYHTIFGSLCVMSDITALKQAEGTLKQRDILFKKLSAYLPGMVFQFVRRPDGTFSFPFATDAIKIIFGCLPEDVRNNFSPIIHAVLPEDRDEFVASIRYSTKHLTHWMHEYRVQVPRGPVRWMLSQATPEKLSDGTIVWYGFIADITKQKKLQEDLKVSQENYQKLFEDHAAVKIVIDPQSGQILDANHAAANYYGWTRNEIKQLKIWHLNTLPEVEVRQAMDKVLQEKRIRFEFRHRLADGSIRDVEVYSSRIKMNGYDVLHSIIHDITEKKRAQEILYRSEAKYRTLFESAIDGIAVLDYDVFIDCNQQMLRLLGMTKDQLIGQTPYRLSPENQPDGENSQKKAMEIIEAAIQGKPQRFEWQHCRYDGTPIDVEVSLNAIKELGNHYIQVVCHDITERKQAEKEIRQLNETLEKRVLERTKELEGFSYSVSHDLRAPLRAINGFSQALWEDYKNQLDSQSQDYLERIRTAANHMGELIEDLLKLSRITRTDMDMTKVNLSHMAASILRELQESQPERKINVIIQEELEDFADARLIRILLENLLGNAWKFTSKRENAEIEFAAKETSGKRVYFVRDNGIGFDRKYVSKLFVPFQRLHDTRDFPGTGIGLAIVQRIVDRHYGSVWVEAELDQGAIFYFTLQENL